MDLTPTQAPIFADDGAAGDRFGHDVAMTDDGLVAVVGAWQHDASGVTDAGAAYVLYNQSGTWAPVAKLEAPEPALDEQMGESVAIAGDRDDFTIVVGSWLSNTAYVFEGGVTSDELDVSFAARLSPSADTSSYFGRLNAVAIQKDGNGNDTIVIGDQNADVTDDNGKIVRTGGAVFGFEEPEGGWHTASDPVDATWILKSDPPVRRGQFGSSTAISILVEVDEITNTTTTTTTIAVGAAGSDEVHIFERLDRLDNVGTYEHRAAIAAPGGVWAVDLSGNGSVLVASTMSDTFVARNEGEWPLVLNSVRQLPETDEEYPDVRFGWTVDINDPGDTIIVGTAGAPAYTFTTCSAGGVEGYCEHARLTVATPTLGSMSAVATNGSVALTGNDRNVGTAGNEVGAVYVYDLAAEPVGKTMHLASMEGDRELGKGEKWNAYITIGVHETADPDHLWLVGATVVGTWSDGSSSSCTTGTEGLCTVTRQNIRSDTVIFRVTDIMANGYTYEAAYNDVSPPEITLSSPHMSAIAAAVDLILAEEEEMGRRPAFVA